MAIDYPAGLPLGLRNGRTYQVVSPLLRTSMSSGRAIQRRKYGFVPEMAQVSWYFNSTQGMTFEAWWRDSLIDGSLWFNMPLRTPIGLNDLECRFTGVYSGPAHAGPDLWSYSAELELRERAAVPDGWGEFPEFILQACIFDIAANEYWPDHDWQTNMDVGDYAINYQWPNA